MSTKYTPLFLKMMANTKPEQSLGVLYRVYPPLDAKSDLRSLASFHSRFVRGLEIRREKNGEIELYVWVENEAALKTLESAYPGAKFEKSDKLDPDFYRELNENAVCFFVVRNHALPWTIADSDNRITYVNDIIRNIDVPCQIQILVQDYDWTGLAEEAAMKMQATIIKMKQGKTQLTFDPRQIFTTELGKPKAEILGSTLVQRGPEIVEDYFEKAHGTPLILSIRGIVAQPTSTLSSALTGIKLRNDSLIVVTSRDPRMLRWLRARAIPDPKPFLELHAKGGFLRDWGKGRELVPAECVVPSELVLYLHLATDPTLPVEYTRTGAIPQLISTPQGFEELKPYLLNRMHKYCIGQTGAGKTTLFLEMVDEWIKQPNPPAIIYVDPKGDDGLKLLKYLPLNEKTVYLNPVTTEFALNPLQLPPHRPEDHDRIVGLLISLFMRLIEEWYGSNVETAVRMCRIMRSFLRAFYTVSDAPTMADMYSLASRMQRGEGKDVLGQFEAVFTAEERTYLLDELETITRLGKEAFDPLLNRLADFALDPFLRKMLCSKNTIDILAFLEPGRITIFSIPSRDVGADRMKIMMSAIALHVWFAVQYRATMTKETERGQVVLAMDEFQNMRELKILPQLLAESRAYGLTLMLLHQNFEQLDDATINSIIGNSGVQISFRVAGEDAGVLGRNWDPRYREQITQEVSVLPLYNILARVQAVGTQEQAPPARYLVPPPHAWINSDETVNEFIEKMKEKYAAKTIVQIFRQDKTGWQCYIPVDVILPPNQFKILTAIYLNGEISYSATLKFAGLHRDESTRKDWDILVQNGWLEIYEGLATKKKTELAKLTAKAQTYLGALTDFSDVGGEEIQKVAKTVWSEYVKAGMFSSVVVQAATEERCDLIAFDFENDRAIAIELESESEVKTHPEQVTRNIKKFSSREFDVLEMWIPAPLKGEVQKLVDSLPREQSRYVTLKTY